MTWIIQALACRHYADAVKFKKVLIPLDGSPASEAVLSHLPDETEELYLLLVLEPHLGAAPGVAAGLGLILTQPGRDRAALEQAEAYLEGLARTLPGKISTLIRHGDATQEIVQAAEELGVELVALTTHGKSCPTRWLVGRVARKVLRRASCPVLVTPVTRDVSVRKPAASRED